MSQPAAYHRAYTVEEYLELEDASPERHEYVAGGIYALAGATKRHNRIVLNMAASLMKLVEEGPCRVYVLDVKLRAALDVIYYPDLMVACGPDEGSSLIEDAPILIVEVASPGTEVVDRREKLISYRRIPSLLAYLIVEQDERRVERHWRDEGGAWWQADLSETGVLPMPRSIGELTMEQIYTGVEFEN